MTEITCRIVDAILAIPVGKVSCYRDIAIRSGMPNGARQVVRVLHVLSKKRALPWHRVIRADGSIALGSGNGRELQIELLRSEGVEVSAAGFVDMAKFRI
jgi:methylated-DNA-protein-cysteine methyltransferase-like protein